MIRGDTNEEWDSWPKDAGLADAAALHHLLGAEHLVEALGRKVAQTHARLP